MRGVLALAVALAAGVLAAVALGQDTGPVRVTVTGTVTPKKAGTLRHPRGISVKVGGKIRARRSNSVPLMPRSVDIWLPKGWRYNGAKHRRCARAKLARRGLRACPAQSIVSRAPGGHADATTPPAVTIVNGGPAKLYLWIAIENPARVRVVVTGTITKVRSPGWSYRLHAAIPDTLRTVAGVPISLTSFHTSTRGAGWFTTTGCPRDHRWRSHLRLTYASGRVADSGIAMACRS
jgi:hypothetical protein